MSRTEGSGASRGGGDEFHNEDVFLVDEGMGLYLVCDGLSAAPAGERASEIAAQSILETVANAEHNLPRLIERGSRSLVAHALRAAIDRVVQVSQTDPALAGMSTTVTMLLVRGDRGVVGQLGDSRAALIRGGRLHRLSADHTLTEILLPVEDRDPLAIETYDIDLRPHDTLILFTDGALAAVDHLDPSRARNSSPRLLASRIVSDAHRRHPELDATAIVVRVLGEAHRAWLELSHEPRDFVHGHRIAVGSGRA